MVLGRSPSSINTRLADCTLPRRGSADIVTLRWPQESSTTIIVSHATCRSRSRSCAAASMEATSTWNFGLRADATAAAAAAAATDTGSEPSPPEPRVAPPLPFVSFGETRRVADGPDLPPDPPPDPSISPLWSSSPMSSCEPPFPPSPEPTPPEPVS